MKKKKKSISVFNLLFNTAILCMVEFGILLICLILQLRQKRKTCSRCGRTKILYNDYEKEWTDGHFCIRDYNLISSFTIF